MMFLLPLIQTVCIFASVGRAVCGDAGATTLSRGAATPVLPDRVLSAVQVNAATDSGAEKTALKTWEDDDDDSSVSIAKGSPAATPANLTVEGAEVVAEGEATAPAAEWPDDDDETIQSALNKNKIETTPEESSHEKKLSSNLKENAVSKGSNEKEKGAQFSSEETGENSSEWADDGDDEDSVQSSPHVNAEKGGGGSSTIVDAGSETIEPVVEWPEDDDEMEGSAAVGVASGGIPSTLGGTGVEAEGIAPVEEWPDDDDEVQGSMAVRDPTATNVIGDGPSAMEGNVLEGEGTQPIAGSSKDHSGAAVGTAGASNNDSFFVGNESTQEGQSTTTTEVDSNEDNLILSPSSETSSAYHRNQSSEGEEEAGAGGNEEAVGALEAGTEIEKGENMSPQDNADIEARGDDTARADNLDTSVAGHDNYIPIDGNNSTQAIIPAKNENELPRFYENDYEDEDDSFISNTFSVLIMAAIFTSVLVFRKRVLDRVQADASLGMASAIKEELVDVVTRLFQWAAHRMREGGHSEAGRNGSSSAADGGSAGVGNSGPFGSETIPLSTATDEEWGWEDEDTRGVPNLELSGIAGLENEEKENDELAMAIAMSLSETEKNEASEGRVAAASVPSAVPKNKFTVHKTKGKGKIQRAPVTPQRESTFETTSPPPPSSIEDLLGQMGGTGGPVITSFGTKPTSKPKQTSALAKKDSSSNDIFATMGLSSFQSTSHQTAAPKTKDRRNNDVVTPTKTPHAPKTTPSLLADAWDEDLDADSWGDDGDLDDLLDD